MKIIQILTFYAALITVVLVVELFFLGQPPKHCRYFVPVVKHPDIYSCSEYPHPVKAQP